MTYELAKQLKDAGFPQRDGDWYTPDGQWIPQEERQYTPTLSELIEACGDIEFCLLGSKENWRASKLNKMEIDWKTGQTSQIIQEGISSTPEEAVANLWLELNKK